MSSRRVLRIRRLTPFKILELSGGKELVVNRWACVSRGDTVYHHERSYYVKCKNGTAKIWPQYNRIESLRIGGNEFRVRVKEITTQEEYDGYCYLSSFHYRGKGNFGRHCIMVMSSTEPLFPKVLGYVEVSSSFLVNRARDTILNSSFADGNLSWKDWRYRTRMRMINAVVRISRVVVHPEFRGLDLGKKLILHALSFSKIHWQLGKYKPIFVEITADMLKFVPFAEHAGMRFVGFTEGNLSRVRDDLRYLIERKGGRYRVKDLGIPDMQGKYATQALRILNGNNLSLDSFLTKLGKVGKGGVNPRTYALLHNIVRFPKPTLMSGLTQKADNFLARRIHEVNVAPPNHNDSVEHLRVDAISEPIGGSGSGKTSFIDLLTSKVKPTNFPVGSVSLPSNSRIGFLKPIPAHKPLIEYDRLFGREIEESIYVLNMAGLSEANLYLRRFDELSEGQKYRAMIARLLSSKSNVWVADDFLGTLDPITSGIVASNFQKFARKVRATVVVAAPNHEHFVKSLLPDRILLKSFGSKCRIYAKDGFLSHSDEAEVLALQ